MEPKRFLRCLGQPALFTATGELIRFRTKKHLALLVYLAVEHRRPHRRERLAEFLWPDASAAEARHSLATALSILRPRLGPGVLETTRDHVILPAGRVVLDLDRLLAGEVLGEETRGNLEVAGFLEGFDIPKAPEFSLWKDRQQARLLPSVKEALVLLIDRCRRTGATREIEELADRMLSIDELSEEAIRAKMEARAFIGDRLTALRIYEEWRERLAEELGAVPSEVVESMAVRLRRRGWERLEAIDIATVPVTPGHEQPFVGRSNEYRALYEGWEKMARGEPAHILLLGDSGVGKTTLVERFGTAVRLEGAVVTRVQCYDLEREIPYSAIGSLVADLLGRPGVSATPPESLAELARTFPEIRRRFPTLPPSVDRQGETARIRLAEAFHDMLTAISEEHPVILVVDDVHLADGASLAVLHLLMRRAKCQFIMAILIARPGELQRSSHARRLLDCGPTLGMLEVEVAPLTPSETRELLRNTIPPDETQPSPAESRALVHASAGIPMVLELLIQDWQTHKGKSLALALDTMTSELEGDNVPPAIYRDALERIARTISPAASSVLNLAAILGNRLNDISLYALADLSVGQTMSGMTELVRRRVLRDAGLGLEFTNELIRTAAYLGVPGSLRKLLHGRIADRLLRERDVYGKDLALAIAWHCFRAGRAEEAMPHLMEGAKEAIRSGAPHAAEHALASALPSLTGHSRSESLMLLVQALQEQGRWQDSLDVLNESDSLHSTIHQQKAVVYRSLAKLNLVDANLLHFDEQVAALAEILRTSSDMGVRANAGCALAYAVAEVSGRNFDQSVLTQLDLVADLGLDSEAEGRLALAKGRLLFQCGDYERAYEIACLAYENLEREGAANLTMAELKGGLGSIRMRQARYHEAIAHYQAALSLANRLGNDSRMVRLMGNLAISLGRAGRHNEQIELVRNSPRAPGPEFTGFSEIQLAYAAASAHAWLQSFDLAAQEIRKLEARLVGPIPGWMLQAWGLWKADILFMSRRCSEAVECARDQLDRDSLILQSPSFAGPFARWVVMVSLADGEPIRARPILEQLLATLLQHDAIDQVEILAAALHLEAQQGHHCEDIAAELEARLISLPASIRWHLASLGLGTSGRLC